MTWPIQLIELLLNIMLFVLAFLWSILVGVSLMLIFGVWWENRKEDSALRTFEWQSEEKLENER